MCGDNCRDAIDVHFGVDLHIRYSGQFINATCIILRARVPAAE